MVQVNEAAAMTGVILGGEGTGTRAVEIARTGSTLAQERAVPAHVTRATSEVKEVGAASVGAQGTRTGANVSGARPPTMNESTIDPDVPVVPAADGMGRSGAVNNSVTGFRLFARPENNIEFAHGVGIDEPALERGATPRVTITRMRDSVARLFGARVERVDVERASGDGPGGMSAPPINTPGGYTIPDTIASCYVVRQGDFWRIDGTDPGQVMDREPHFRDHGSRLSTPGNDRNTISDMVMVARAKGWGEVTLTGSDAFCRNAWIEASLAGVSTRGFKPHEQDLALLEAARRDRETLTIRAGVRNHVPDMGISVPPDNDTRPPAVVQPDAESA